MKGSGLFWIREYGRSGEPDGCDYPSDKMHGLDSQIGSCLPGEADKVDNGPGRQRRYPATVTPHHDMIDATRYMYPCFSGHGDMVS